MNLSTTIKQRAPFIETAYFADRPNGTLESEGYWATFLQDLSEALPGDAGESTAVICERAGRHGANCAIHGGATVESLTAAYARLRQLTFTALGSGAGPDDFSRVASVFDAALAAAVAQFVARKASPELGGTHWRSAFEHAAVGFAVSDADGRFVQVNPRFCEMLGYTEAELKGRTTLDIVHPEDRTLEVQRLEELHADRVSHVVIEKRLMHKDGHAVCVRNSVSTTKGALGRLTIRVAEDVTMEREAERRRETLSQELAEARRDVDREQSKFETIFSDSATSMAVLRGPQFIYEIANPSYMALFNNRDILDKPFVEALPELVDQPFPRHAREVFETGLPYQDREALAFLQRTSDGPVEERYFDQAYTRMLDRDGLPYGVFIHAVEVTERVQSRREIERAKHALSEAKERAESANAAKSAFLANMSHEIRTPLGAIMGFVSLIKDEELSQQMLLNYVSVIERNSIQLMRIIDDILDLSKVEAGMMLIEHIDFSLIELLSDFSSLMGFRARERGILFELKARSELPNIINSDPTRLRQILTNIVGNAIKFTERGTVQMFVSFDDDRLTFEVHDTGRGITADQAQHLFQPFSQGDVSTTRKYGGTGLGLVLTRRLAEALEGKFELVESTPGQGSVFRAQIAVKLSAESKLVRALGFATEPIRNAGVAARLRGLRVLLVEDSPDNQALYSIYLSLAGAKIDIASDGAHGYQMALGDTYDVILMDVQMPIMDGITAVRKLRGQGFKTPIIALTAHAMKEERQRCLEAGYDNFLSKPVHRTELIETLLPFVQAKASS